MVKRDAWFRTSRGGWSRQGAVVAVACGAAILVGGCVLLPEGASEEQAKLGQQAAAFDKPLDQRQLPPLPNPAGWREVLKRAFLANGELEAAYFEWKVALARVDQAATWPNSNIAVSYSYLFSSGEMKAWDRSTIGVGFDPSMNLQLPAKTRAAGKAALDAAREAGERLRTAKFDLQRRVLDAYLDLALVEEKARIAHRDLDLLRRLSDSTTSRVEAGAPLQDLLKVQSEMQMVQNELASMQADAGSMRSMLNGMLARDAAATLDLPPGLPLPRPVAADDATLIAMGVAQNPQLAALAQQVAGRKDAIEVARLAYLPDLTPSASFTGSIMQTVGGMAMLPTTLPAIRAMVDDAEAMSRATQAMLRQTRDEQAARFVANLYAMRNAERQVRLYRESLVPITQRVVTSSRQAYASGMMGLGELIDSQRMLLSLEQMAAEAEIEREKRLAELEALAGTDIETLGQPPATIKPATASAPSPAPP